MEPVGSRIRRLREAKGLTQRELAEPHYSHAYVSIVEAGRRRPSREALDRFAAKLGINVDDLITGRPPGVAARLELEIHEARLELSSGRVDEAERAFERLGRRAADLALPRLEAKSEEGRALCAERRGDGEAALERYVRARRCSVSSRLRRGRRGCRASRCHEMLGDARYAIHLLESYLSELEREGLTDPDALVRIYSSLVLAYFEVGLYERAESFAGMALALASGIEDPIRLAQMHMNVARVHLHKGKFEEAQRCLHRAEQLYRDANLQTEMGGALLASGYVLSRRGQREDAKHHLERARVVFANTNNPLDEARVLNELARIHRLEGAIQEAKKLLELSLARTEGRDVTVLAWTHRELGLCQMQLDDVLAEKHLRRSIELYEQTDDVVQTAITYGALGDLFHARGDAEPGRLAYRTGFGLLEERL